MRSLKKQSGSFVIEALISILLFAVGIVALMMVMAQSTNQSGLSKVRNDASYLAGELIGDLWVSVSSTGASSTAVSLGSVDISAWQSRVATVMPPGSAATVSYPTNTGINILIQWPDAKDPTAAPHQYQTYADIVKN